MDYKYNRKKDSKEILYKEEPVTIPLVEDAMFCNYKYILPENYIGLGSEYNFLKQESDTIYTFYGDCPLDGDTIRYSPKQSYWKASMEISFQNNNKLVNDIIVKFSRYYKGGKLRNEYYNISSLDGNDLMKMIIL